MRQALQVVLVVLVLAVGVPASARAAESSKDDVLRCTISGSGGATGFYEGRHWDFLPDNQLGFGYALDRPLGTLYPGSWSVSVDWGDGSPVEAPTAPTVTGPLPPDLKPAPVWLVHTFAPGTYRVHVVANGTLNMRSDGSGETIPCHDDTTTEFTFPAVAPVAPPGVEQVPIVFRTLIASNYIEGPFPPHPQSTCVDFAGNQFTLIGAGDDRGFSRTAGTHKTRQTITFERRRVNGRWVAQLKAASSDVGVSRSYVRAGAGGALDHGVRGRIDASDVDGELGDCNLDHGEHQGTPVPKATAQKLRQQVWRVSFRGKSRNGLIPLSPSIDWNFHVDVDLGAARPHVVDIAGTHDYFPFYEVYLGTAPIYRFTPPPLRGKPLPLTRIGWTTALGLCDICTRGGYTIP